jgi:hypothetical protein
MANDNDKKNPILNRQPNTLEGIGSQGPSSPLESLSSKDMTAPYRRELALSEQRARMQTQEMQRVARQIQELESNFQRAQAMVARVRGGQGGVNESLFRDLGLTAQQAGAVMKSIPPERHVAAVVAQSKAYETQYRTQMQQYEDRYRDLQQNRQEVAGRQFEQFAMSRAHSSRQGIRGIMAEPEVMALAAEFAQKGTLPNLQKGLSRATSGRQTAEIAMAALASDINQPGGREGFLTGAQKLEMMVRKEAALQGAIQTKENQRAGYSDLLGYSQRNVERIEQARGVSEIKEGVASGRYGSIGNITAELRKREADLESATTKFAEALNSGAEDLSGLSRNLEDANKLYEEQKKVLKESIDSGGGGGGRFSRSAGRWIPTIQAGIGVAQYAAVGADEQQMALRTTAAAMMNQRNTDIMAASQGDMAALRRISSKQFEAAAQFGGAYGTRSLIAKGADVAATGVMAGVQGGTAFLGGGSLAGSMMNASYAAAGGIEMGKGITRASTELQLAGQYGNLMDTVNQVPDAAKQAFYNYRMGALHSMRGAGGGFSNLYATATSDATLKQMAGFGISPEQSAELFGVGARAIGNQFTRNPNQAANIVGRAGELQAAGYMSAQDYLGRVGQMTQLGGSQKDVEDILTSAVARGVDDAKSLDGLFTMAQALSRDSASRGIGAVGAVQGAMGIGLDIYKNLPIDESLKQNLVQSQLQQNISRMTNVAVDPANMIYMANMQRSLPGASKLGLSRLAGVSPLELEALQSQYFTGMKTGDVVPEAVRSALGTSREAFVDEQGRYRGRGAVDASKLNAVYKGIQDYIPLLRPEEQQALNKAITTGDMKALDKFPNVGAILPPGAIPSAIAAYGQNYKVPKSPIVHLAGEAAAAEKAGAIGMSALTNQILQGGEAFSPFAPSQFNAVTGKQEGGGPMSGLTQLMMESAVDKLDTQKAGEEAAAAAKGMTLDTSAFDKSIDNFDKAVNKLVEAIAPMGGGVNIDWDSASHFSNYGMLSSAGIQRKNRGGRP